MNQLRKQNDALAGELAAFLISEGYLADAGRVLEYGSRACNSYHRALRHYVGSIGFSATEQQ